ncbi:hypothetical protein D7U89_06675 [Stenotrophomonas maltophilia]|uniref:hypothetical protein n=1 Tax=Stenotrophomonas maltophilia TaxID=40324 RepID=UPI0015DF7690|nr:hypothetical protein [Stenotrophomonas maltophilia]MBA0225176.1 hypothetical protein [Stenotrophomonas maltophilia]MBA0365296.1 hypothetical protein [Stenotrophomonas maltophilia]
MKSLTITYDDAVARSRSLREHIATQVYAGAGVTAVAGRLDMAPSKLSEKLAGCDSSGKPRGLSIDDLERYVQVTKDVSPIHYLIERYLITPEAATAEALAELHKQLSGLSGTLAKLGVRWP